jgi:hypothetical protein
MRYAVQIALLRVLYLHPYFNPFTLFNPMQPMVLRLLFLTTSVMSQLFLACIMYSFLNPPGEVDPAAPPPVLDFNGIAASLIMTALQTALDTATFALVRNASAAAFSYRYPTLSTMLLRLRGAEEAVREELRVARKGAGAGKGKGREPALPPGQLPELIGEAVAGAARRQRQPASALECASAYAAAVVVLLGYIAFCLFYVALFAVSQPSAAVARDVLAAWARTLLVLLLLFPVLDLGLVGVSIFVLPALGELAAQAPGMSWLLEAVSDYSCGPLVLAPMEGVLGTVEGTLSGRLANVTLLRAVARVQGLPESHLVVALAFQAVVAREEGQRRSAAKAAAAAAAAAAAGGAGRLAGKAEHRAAAAEAAAGAAAESAEAEVAGTDEAAAAAAAAAAAEAEGTHLVKEKYLAVMLQEVLEAREKARTGHLWQRNASGAWSPQRVAQGGTLGGTARTAAAAVAAEEEEEAWLVRCCLDCCRPAAAARRSRLQVPVSSYNFRQRQLRVAALAPTSPASPARLG